MKEQKPRISDEIDWKKDKQSVNNDWSSVSKLIEGVKIKELKSLEDKRGNLVEMYNSDWNIHPEPLVQAYQVTVKPGAIRGWELHLEQDDRLFLNKGLMRWVLYDTRMDSSTYKMINEFVVSELNRVLMIVPKGVVHAVKNIGTDDALFTNFPTTAYNYQNPDKIRPVDTTHIPFSFDDGEGW